MRRLLRWSTHLYPKVWRARYSVEFDLLLKDAEPRWTDLFDILRGALTMQMTTLNFWKIALVFTIAGALISGAWSLMLSERYVSTAVLNVRDPSRSSPKEGRPHVSTRLRAVQESAFSRNSLTAIIQQQNLYPRERARLPLEDIVENMRKRDIRVTRLNDSQISLSYTNAAPGQAQAGVLAIVSAMIEANSKRLGGNPLDLEVIESASLPASASGPDRGRLLLKGVLAGLGAGILFGSLWTIGRRRERWSLKRVGGFACAGVALGIAVAVMLPDEYISTAVLRAGKGDQVPAALQTALSDASLREVIEKLDLYRTDRRTKPIATVVAKMRATAIRVQTVSPSEKRGSTRVFTVSVIYPDRYKAQAVTRELVSRITGTVPAEVLDAASMPEAPSYPNRPEIAGLGLLTGALLGLAASRFSRAEIATT